MSKVAFLALACVWLGMTGGRILAAPITYTGTLRVTSSPIGSGISDGDSIGFSFTFDNSVLDASDSPVDDGNFGIFPSAVTAFSLAHPTLGSVSFDLSSAQLSTYDNTSSLGDALLLFVLARGLVAARISPCPFSSRPRSLTSSTTLGWDNLSVRFSISL